MDKKSLVKETGYKLRKLRESKKWTHREIAEHLDLDKSSYSRYEDGSIPPRFTTLCKLGTDFGLSLDWFILNRGPMHYEEIGKKLKVAEEVKKEPEPSPLDDLSDDVIEMLEHMKQIPTLRYEVLLFFHKFKKEHKERVEEAMNDNS